MQVFSASDVESGLDDKALVEALRAAFQADIEIPQRSHFTLPQTDGSTPGTLLIMPAWQAGEYAGIKMVGVFPDNAKHQLDSINGAYLLMSASTGMPLAIMDGAALTARRTATVSALASDYLAAPEIDTHLVIGAGRLSAPLALAHRQVRPIRKTLIWARRPEQAEAQVAVLKEEGVDAAVAESLPEAAAEARLITVATMASTPVLLGRWVQPGTHVDLVGAYRPDMREADDEVLKPAQIVVDTLPGGIEESGELSIPLNRGVIKREQIRGDLTDLCTGRISGRTEADAVTVFKSVGTARSDLAAACLLWTRSRAG